MERDGRSVASFLASGPLVAGESAVLDAAAAHHARVRRLEVGEPVRVTDGRGSLATGSLRRIAKSAIEIDIERVVLIPASRPVTMLVPVADRDRMLWLAEKCCELAVAIWQPVIFERSRSVSPRGEGPAFREKVVARMRGAVEQSGGAWLPEVRPESTVDAALASTTGGTRLLLDAGGAPILSDSIAAPVAIACGPEGGVTPEERELFLRAGWRAARIADTTLRFETAALAGVAIVHAALTRASGG